MIGIKNIRLVLAGALIVPVALASIACSPIYADDPNAVKKEIFTPELDLEALNGRIQSAVESGEISQAQVDQYLTDGVVGPLDGPSAAQAAVCVSNSTLRRRSTGFQHVAELIYSPAWTIQFVARQYIGWTGR